METRTDPDAGDDAAAGGDAPSLAADGHLVAPLATAAALDPSAFNRINATEAVPAAWKERARKAWEYYLEEPLVKNCVNSWRTFAVGDEIKLAGDDDQVKAEALDLYARLGVFAFVKGARVRGRLYDGPGFPILEVPDKDILAYGTANPLADVATQARLADWARSCPQSVPESATEGAWGAVYGELLTFDDPRLSPPRHRPPGGLPPGRFQPLPARAGTRHGERRLGTRLGLHGRDDRHQTPPDRVRSLAGLTAHGLKGKFNVPNRPKYKLTTSLTFLAQVPSDTAVTTLPEQHLIESVRINFVCELLDIDQQPNLEFSL